jgi:hypothetical protein
MRSKALEEVLLLAHSYGFREDRNDLTVIASHRYYDRYFALRLVVSPIAMLIIGLSTPDVVVPT